jgi:hypothetical protein
MRFGAHLPLIDFIWPLAEPERQLELFRRDVAPAVTG